MPTCARLQERPAHVLVARYTGAVARRARRSTAVADASPALRYSVVATVRHNVPREEFVGVPKSTKIKVSLK